MREAIAGDGAAAPAAAAHAAGLGGADCAGSERPKVLLLNGYLDRETDGMTARRSPPPTRTVQRAFALLVAPVLAG